MVWGGSRTDPKVGQNSGPPEEDGAAPQPRYFTRLPQGPPSRHHPSGISYVAVSALLLCTKSHDVVSALPALHNHRFTDLFCFSLIFLLQKTPEFFKVKGF